MKTMFCFTNNRNNMECQQTVHLTDKGFIADVTVPEAQSLLAKKNGFIDVESFGPKTPKGSNASVKLRFAYDRDTYAPNRINVLTAPNYSKIVLTFKGQGGAKQQVLDKSCYVGLSLNTLTHKFFLEGNLRGKSPNLLGADGALRYCLEVEDGRYVQAWDNQIWRGGCGHWINS